MSRVLSLRSRRGPYHRRKVPSFTVPVYGHGACLCSRAMFERVQCVKTRILRRSEVVTCTYYTGDGSRTTIADVRPLDRTSSSCVYKIVIFWSTYAWTHPPVHTDRSDVAGEPLKVLALSLGEPCISDFSYIQYFLTSGPPLRSTSTSPRRLRPTLPASA